MSNSWVCIALQRMKQIILWLALSCEVGSYYIHLVSWNNSHPFQWLECVPWPLVVTTDYYPWNSCWLTTDRVVFVGPCMETAIIAGLPCYSRMYMVLSTYVLDFVWYVYISPFFWWRGSGVVISVGKKVRKSSHVCSNSLITHLVSWTGPPSLR